LNFKAGDTVEYVTGVAPKSLGTPWRRATVVAVGDTAVRLEDEDRLFWVPKSDKRIRKVEDDGPAT
jgi:hypothetical protein